jgi:hypothetical protein
VRWDRTYLKNGVLANGPKFVAGKPVATTDVWEEPAVSWSVGANLRLTERQNCTARLAVSEQSAELQIRFEYSRRVCHDSHQVGCHAKFGLNTTQQFLCFAGCLFGIDGRDSGHGST